MSADPQHGGGGGESGPAPQQRRRLSRPDLGGISAIFNPRKQLRRSSTAISQLFGTGPRPPSVVITDDNSSDNLDYGGYGPPYNVYGGHYYLQHRGSSGDMTGGLQGPSSSSVNLPSSPSALVGGHQFIQHSRNIPHLSALGPSFSGSLASMQGGQGVLASSVPLLADVQHQMSVNLDGSGGGNPVGASNYPHQPNPSNNNNNNNANNNNQANLKPIAKTIATIKRAIFSKTARKLCCGVILSLIVGACWTIIIHSIKRVCVASQLFEVDGVAVIPAEGDLVGPSDGTYYGNGNGNAVDPYNGDRRGAPPPPSGASGGGHVYYPSIFGNYNITNGLDPISPQTTAATTTSKMLKMKLVYDAPFFTAWILTFCTVLFYPFHQMTVRFCSCMGRKGPKSMSRAVSDAIQGFRERGMTLFQFMGRCAALCFMWLFTNYLLISSMRNLRATESLSLFATTTSFAYLLSWVILHQQFVGLRILAVILSNMGIALFAYMDGMTHKSKTVGGVLFGALAACCAAVFKVILKKMFGVGATISQQVALIFSVMGLISIVLLWPIFLTLYFTGLEVILWQFVPWNFIVFAVLAFLLVSMLDNFGVTCTFEFFITIGLLLAIPFTAALDHQIYGHIFGGMCLAGIITISIGFLVVLLPENWPDYITRLIRYLAQLKHHSRWGRNRRGGQSQNEPIDTRTGHIRSHLRSPSGRRMTLLDLGLRKHFALAATTSITTPSPTGGQPFILLRRKNTQQELHPLDYEQENEILTPLLELPHC